MLGVVNAECHVFILMLNVVMLSFIVLSVIILSDMLFSNAECRDA
jgi:hypothetical protein